MTGPILVGLLVFALCVPWGGRLVQVLLSRGIGKNIRQDGPATHQYKSGTATMGGIYFLGAITLTGSVLLALGHTEVLGPLLAMLGFGALGAYDDLQGLRDGAGVGWLARSKFPAQWALALVLALLMYWLSDAHPVALPFAGPVVEMGWWSVPLLAVALVGMSNAVNLTDGLDGLAGGASVCGFGAYAVITLATGQRGLALLSASVVGALGAFLWYNVHPARMFMGDTGSQALGAGLAAVAILSGHWIELVVIGGLFVAEAISVMLQVAYFKYTRKRFGKGRRIFRMAPLHHHFELGGWSEVQVTQRLWIVAALCGTLGVLIGVGQ